MDGISSSGPYVYTEGLSWDRLGGTKLSCEQLSVPDFQEETWAAKHTLDFFFFFNLLRSFSKMTGKGNLAVSISDKKVWSLTQRFCF